MLELIDKGEVLAGVDPNPEEPWPCGHNGCTICGTVKNNQARLDDDSTAWYHT